MGMGGKFTPGTPAFARSEDGWSELEASTAALPSERLDYDPEPHTVGALALAAKFGPAVRCALARKMSFKRLEQIDGARVVRAVLDAGGLKRGGGPK